MKSTSVRSLLMCGILVFASPAYSQSAPVGLNFAEVELSYGTFANTGGPMGRLTGDFRIADAIGLQLDVSALSYPGGSLGQIDAHVYLVPNDHLKYGLFLSIADVDGREATIGSVGATVMATFSDSTQIEAEAEIGIGSSRLSGKRRNMDFIAGSLGVSHQFNDAMTLFVKANATEFDETYLRAVAYGLRLGMHYDIPGQPIRISAAFGYDKMSGRDSRPGEAVAQIGVTWRFGTRGSSVKARSFGRSKPLDQLLRRGLF